MKKLFGFATIAAMLCGFASCSNELDAPVAGGDGNVNFTVALPGTPGTRAFSDGLTAENLQVAVYDVTDPDNVVLATTKEQDFGNSLQTTVNLNLANGRSYKIAFFASLKEDSPYTFDTANKKITVDYSKMTEYNNTDNYDCFYQLFETGKVTASINETITLYRPVAQINWGTSDLKEDVLKVIYGENDLENLYTKVTTMGYTEFDMFAKDVVEGTQENVTYALATRPAATENFPYQPKGDDGEPVKTYDYLSMQYLLVPQASSLVDLKLESAASATATDAIAVVDVPNAPVQANYRTNIFGALLTNPGVFNVIKEENYETPDNNIEIVAVNDATGLVAAVADGKEAVLQSDVAIAGLTFTDAPAIINLNGHNLDIKNEEDPNSQILVPKGSKLTIKGSGTENLNVGIKNGLRVNSGELEIEGVEINDTYHASSTGLLSLVFVGGDDAKVSIKNTIINVTNPNTYAITSNASSPNTNMQINLEGVSVKTQVPYGWTHVLINNPVVMTAKDCYFEGCNQAAILRGGTYSFENCTFVQNLATDENHNTTTTKDAIKNSFRAQNRAAWGQGTTVPLAAITMGNDPNSTSYQYPTNVTLKGCTVSIPEVAKNTGDRDASLPAVYVSANSGAGLGVTFTYDAATKINGELEWATGNIVINGDQKTEAGYIAQP